MRVIGKIFGIVFALVIAVVIGVFFWISDANRLKPELALLIEQNSDYTVQFNGDLAWALWPPVSLTVEDLIAEYKDKLDPGLLLQRALRRNWIYPQSGRT